MVRKTCGKFKCNPTKGYRDIANIVVARKTLINLKV